jgi:hypothetical protein
VCEVHRTIQSTRAVKRRQVTESGGNHNNEPKSLPLRCRRQGMDRSTIAPLVVDNYLAIVNLAIDHTIDNTARIERYYGTCNFLYGDCLQKLDVKRICKSAANPEVKSRFIKRNVRLLTHVLGCGQDICHKCRRTCHPSRCHRHLASGRWTVVASGTTNQAKGVVT